MSGLKQRIIGALVLISLAVIFVPMMFDEPHDEGDVRTLDVPEEPPFPEVSEPEEDSQLSGVPDYRVEEVEPAPAPEVVEDPPMGTQPAQGTREDSPPSDEQVPLVGEQEERGEPPVEDQAADNQASRGGESEAGAEDTASGQSDSATESTADTGSAGGSADFERSLDGAWVLQLGSFGNEQNARRLRDNVRERGYGAHLQEFRRGDQRLVRVFSGPFAEKKEAEDAKAVLDEAFGVKALVTKGAD